MIREKAEVLSDENEQPLAVILPNGDSLIYGVAGGRWKYVEKGKTPPPADLRVIRIMDNHLADKLDGFYKLGTLDPEEEATVPTPETPKRKAK